ncbi:MAG: leucine-rich repeat domain-containing protein, partial [Actinomycetota bacterium]|nr:leucine-rich repeat domain-containing protein [Actinomycetota bacterium]
MHGQQLAVVLPHTFTGLSGITDIDLSANHITAVHAGAFSPHLQRLSLYGNRQIAAIEPGALPPSLESLVMTFPPDRSASACSVGVQVATPTLLPHPITCTCAAVAGEPRLRGGDLGYCTANTSCAAFDGSERTPPAPEPSELLRVAPITDDGQGTAMEVLLSPPPLVVNESYYLPAVFGLPQAEAAWNVTVRSDRMRYYYKNYTGTMTFEELHIAGLDTEEMSYGWPDDHYWSGEGTATLSADGAPPGVLVLELDDAVREAIAFYHSPDYCAWDGFIGAPSPHWTSPKPCDPVPDPRTDGLTLQLDFSTTVAPTSPWASTGATLNITAFPQRFSRTSPQQAFNSDAPVQVTAGFPYGQQATPLPNASQIVSVRGFGAVPVDIEYGFDELTDPSLTADPYIPNPFRVDAATGVLEGVLPANLSAGLYRVAIAATDVASGVPYDRGLPLADFELNVS